MKNHPLQSLEMRFRMGIGQDSHRFLSESASKPCVIGGVVIPHAPGLDADSDGDVILHAICQSISSLTHVPILGKVAIELCHKQGITDSKAYLAKALETLDTWKIEFVSLSIEGARPRLQSYVDAMRARVATLLSISLNQVGITITSGDQLTDFGKGLGLQCWCALTVFQM